VAAVMSMTEIQPVMAVHGTVRKLKPNGQPFAHPGEENHAQPKTNSPARQARATTAITSQSDTDMDSFSQESSSEAGEHDREAESSANSGSPFHFPASLLFMGDSDREGGRLLTWMATLHSGSPISLPAIVTRLPVRANYYSPLTADSERHLR
jgi:hypothetical protein